MVKVKNRKRVSVDDIQKRRQVQNEKKKVLNPFEVHINKEKMRILGKKSNNQKGVPGISRAKAIQKRKHTLLSEYKLQHKSNKFIDKRIGEKSKMPTDEKVAVRFAAFKAKAHSKQSIFNLSSDVLSHKEHTLSEIEKFEDLSSDDEHDDDDRGKLDSDFIEEAHFGNGVLVNTGVEGVKAHKNLIEQLIEESKKRKAEQQKIREATLELTEKLDSEWKDLVQLVSKKSKNDDNKDENKSKVDDYDKYMRELKFEARGTVSDRLKTEDEIAKEEKERLEKLEQERIDRMKGVVENNGTKVNHRSADDLDDNFVYESDTEENMLSYDTTGQSNVHVQAELNGKIIGEPQDNDEDNEVEEEESGSEGEEDGDSEAESEDSLADLKDDIVSDDENEAESKPNDLPIKKDKTSKLNTNGDLLENKSNKRKSLESSEKSDDPPKSKRQKSISEEENEVDSQSNEEELEEAGNELPFTFNIPDSYESLMETFKDKSCNHQKVILERMIKCNHPSLAQGNKESLGVLFDYILQYLNDLFTDIESDKSIKQSFQIFKCLMPHIYNLAQLNPENTHKSILEVIKEKHQEYRKKKKRRPGVEVLVFLKLVSLLFSTSDFRHRIVTPCFVFMEQMLKCCSVKSAADVSYGLFLCTLILEYTSLSKRYLPLSINFLSGILHMSIPKTSVKVIKVVPPFKSLSSDLVLTKKCLKSPVTDKLNISVLLQTEFTNEFKISALYTALKLLKDFKETFSSYSSNVEIFATIESYLPQIPIDLYPERVRVEYKEFIDELEKQKSERKLYYLVLEQKRPKALRLYEPKIEKVYDGKRHKTQSREKAEREKLVQKLKKESKGALREIRRDKSFLARVKINRQIQSDKERREKVNRIFAEAASQQNELNTLDRKKKKK
ncbi:hypothetical protein GWI33_014529 [Rhynchophorus ferrugineus]|uniref:Nucleolar protein 14 n=1 Tax=Rhynchophorus ferrugineus TaxID=354439 RepID=A0A834I1A2_RHYFE|nr:hypothetical protein GWI33_014529 [Rhynchophorus ferrugineus]